MTCLWFLSLQVKQIAEAYERKHNKSLEKAICDTFSGQLETAVVSLLYDPIDFYARRLKVQNSVHKNSRTLYYLYAPFTLSHRKP
jgi:hypothetical protein